MPTHLILVPAEDPQHGIRLLFATPDGAGSPSPSYVDADGIAHKVPFDRVFPLADAVLGYHDKQIASAIREMMREGLA